MNTNARQGYNHNDHNTNTFEDKEPERVISFARSIDLFDDINPQHEKPASRYNENNSKNMQGASIQVIGGAEKINAVAEGLNQAFDAIYELEERIENKLDTKFDHLLAQLTTRMGRL